MRNEAETQRVLNLYADMVRRICLLHLKNYADVEDVFQDVFLKYLLYDRPFESDAHEKAWLIRVSVNACKDSLKSFFRRKVSSLDALDVEPSCLQKDESDRELWEAVFQLPANYRNVIYLFYYEGYTAVEIAKMIGRRENTVYTWLSRAKKQMKEQLGGEISG